MLNVLRILSWFVVVFAVLTVIVLFGMWQTGEKEIVGFLKQQSAIDQMRLQNSDEDEQQGDCRLVLASIAFARRLNPPVVRDEAAVKDPQDGQEEVTDSIIRKPPDTDIKTPPLATPKFELIGTVVCEDLPEKSMALIKLSNGKWQWFQKGQQLGHHLLGDIRNGRAFIRQNGKTTEFVVPEKPRGQQLVRGDSL